MQAWTQLEKNSRKELSKVFRSALFKSEVAFIKLA